MKPSPPGAGGVPRMTKRRRVGAVAAGRRIRDLRRRRHLQRRDSRRFIARHARAQQPRDRDGRDDADDRHNDQQFDKRKTRILLAVIVYSSKE